VLSTEANAADVISIMNGKLTHTLKMHTVIAANVGSARNNNSPRPSARARVGTGLSGVATSQFQAVDDTTIGTTQGNISRILNTVLPGILVRSNSAKPMPISQEPNTPTMVNTRVNRAAFQNDALVRTST
jgi:hypothetical protein